MIPASRAGMAAALALAVAAHGAVLVGLHDAGVVEIDGSPGTGQARIGTGFADLVAGTLSPVSPERTSDADPADPIQPAPLETVTNAEPAPPAPPVLTATDPLQPVPVPSPEAIPAITPEPVSTQAPDRLAALLPETITPPDAPAPVAKSDPPTPAIAESLRPVARDPDFAPVREPQPPRKQPPKAQPVGNAKRDQAAGAATGQQAAKSSRSGAAANGTEQGNAAASSYPGRVMRKISRVSRPRVGLRGKAVIAFTIASNGGLSGVSVAKSSGSAKLDAAALQVVRRAAPFPAPPRNARRSFSISIVGR